MPQEITFYRRSVYGVEHMYIADPTMAGYIWGLTGTKTMLKQHKRALELMGYTFTEVLPPR
jgi:hypothetical protein